MKTLTILISSIILISSLNSCSSESDRQLSKQSNISDLNYYRSIYSDSLNKSELYVDAGMDIWSSQHSIIMANLLTNNRIDAHTSGSITMDSIEIMSIYRTKYKFFYFKDQINKINSQLLILHSSK